MALNMAFDMEAAIKESKDARLKFLEDQSMAALKIAVSHTPYLNPTPETLSTDSGFRSRWATNDPAFCTRKHLYMCSCVLSTLYICWKYLSGT